MPTSGSGAASGVVAPANGVPGEIVTTAAALLTAAGVTGVADAALLGHARTALREWEALTGHRPFVAGAAPSARRYTLGEAGAQAVDLLAGAVEVTGVTLGEETIALTGSRPDAFLMPDDAPLRGEPYTWLEFRYRRFSEAQGLVVTARWGYADELPPDALAALAARAASLAAEPAIRAAQQAATAAGGRLKRVKEGDVEREYSEGTSVTERRALFEQWEAQWDSAWPAYKLLTVH